MKYLGEKKILRETDVCPLCFKRDKLFEEYLYEVHSDKTIPIWGCERCEIAIKAGTENRVSFDYEKVQWLRGRSGNHDF